MTRALWEYAAGIALIMALLAGIYGYGHHNGYASGTKAGNARAAAALIAQNIAEQNTATMTMTLRQVNASTDKAKAEADAASKRAAEAVKQAAATKHQADRDAAAFAKQLDAAMTQPQCQGLKEEVCAIVYPY